MDLPISNAHSYSNESRKIDRNFEKTECSDLMNNPESGSKTYTTLVPPPHFDPNLLDAEQRRIILMASTSTPSSSHYHNINIRTSSANSVNTASCWSREDFSRGPPLQPNNYQGTQVRLEYPGNFNCGWSQQKLPPSYPIDYKHHRQHSELVDEGVPWSHPASSFHNQSEQLAHTEPHYDPSAPENIEMNECYISGQRLSYANNSDRQNSANLKRNLINNNNETSHSSTKQLKLIDELGEPLMQVVNQNNQKKLADTVGIQSQDKAASPSFILNLLNKSWKGKLCIEAYKLDQKDPKEKLFEGHVHDVSDIVLDYEYNNGRHDHEVKRYEFLARSIVQLFPNQYLCDWYTPSEGEGSTARGYLIVALKKYRASSKEKHMYYGTDKLTGPKVLKKRENLLKGVRECLVVDDEFKSNWDYTYASRVKVIKNHTPEEICKIFPCLSQALGYELLIRDFNFIHSGSTNKLFENWPAFSKKIMLYANKKISEMVQGYENIKLIVENNKNSGDETSAIFLLPYFFKINSYLKYADKNDKLKTSDVENSFIYKIKNIEDFDDGHKCLESAYKKINESVVKPYILICQSLDGKSTEYYVVLHKTCKYKFNNLLEAVDVCFKCTKALNIDFSKISLYIWQLLDFQIYETLKSPYKAVTKFLKDLNLN